MILSRPASNFFKLNKSIRCFATRSNSSVTSRLAQSAFGHDQNEDDFMIVGKGAKPSALRPNLFGNPSTTSDENWARILEDVDPPSPHHLHATRSLKPGALLQRSHKKYTATELELRAMEDIFERVFDMDASVHPQAYNLGAGRVGSPFNSSKRQLSRTNELDHELQFDKKREEMFRCKSDRELLQWAMREVFDRPSTKTVETSLDSPSTTPEIAQADTRALHPEIYGRMVASLMKEFREQYNNPHLAIAIFDYTRRLSIISYVTGCTAASYSELMHTHWVSFRNLRAVVNVAEEMRVNGVLPHHTTADLLNQIHDELEPVVKLGEAGDPEIAKLVERLDELLRPPKYEPITPQNQRHRESDDRNNKGQELFGGFLSGNPDLLPNELASTR